MADLSVNAKSTPLSVCLLITSLGFDSPEFIVWVGPISLDLFNLSSDKSKTNILLASTSMTVNNLIIPIGPTSKLATVSLNRTSPSLLETLSDNL